MLRRFSKLFPSSESAIADIKNSTTLLIGGFGVCGVPENLLRAIEKSNVSDLNIYTNLSGTNNYGPGMLVSSKKVSSFHASYIGANEELERQYLNGEIELELIPQGTLIEKFRAGCFGILGFYTPTGVDTDVESGGIPLKFKNGGGSVEKFSEPKPFRLENGRKYLYESAARGDIGIIKAWKADKAGNLIYRKTARNSNSDIAGACKITIAEAEEIVETGELDPSEIHTPGILVQRIVKGEYYEKPIGSLTLNTGDQIVVPGSPEQVKKKLNIAKRAAKEIKDGMYVNLGIGLPTLIANFVPKGIKIMLQGENGILGIGPYPAEGFQDPDLTNPGKETVTAVKGASTFASSTSFGIIRGSHLDLTVMGGLQVSQNGDLANWVVPGKMVKGMGGAMDLVSSKTRCLVCMEHTAKKTSRVVDTCSFPLTGKQIVSILITDLAVFEFIDGSMVLTEIAEGITLDHLKSQTSANYQISSSLKKIQT